MILIRSAPAIAFYWIALTFFAGCRQQPLPRKADPQLDSAAAKETSLDSVMLGDVDRLLIGLHDRLELMPLVARWKWKHGAAIEDTEREDLLVDRFVADATMLSIDSGWARKVIIAQIRAAKGVQRGCFQRWELFPPDKNEPVVELQTDLRPRIERVTFEILKALGELEKHRDSSELVKTLRSRSSTLLGSDSITDEVRQAALSPWDEEGD